MTKPKIRVVGKRIVRDASDVAGADLSDILFDDFGHMCVQEERLADPTDDVATAELRATRLSAYASTHAKLTPSAFAAFHAMGDVFAVESAVIDARLTARSPHVLVDVILPSHRWRMAVERAFNCALLAFACPHLHASTELQHCLPEKQRFGAQEYGIDAGYALDRLRQKNVLVTRLADDGLPPALSPHVDVSIDMSMLSGTHLASAVDRAFVDGDAAANRRSAWPDDLPAEQLRPEWLDAACDRAVDPDGVVQVVRALLDASTAARKSEATKRAAEEKENLKAKDAKKGSVEILRPDSPQLTDLHGYGAASDWGMQLAADVDDYRLGVVPWADVDGACLMTGPPGTGKTLFARALAATCGVAFLPTSFAAWQGQKGGYLGDIVNAMRAVFAAAAENAPCILFIDEIDSIPSRGSSDRHDDYWRPIVNAALECLDGTTRREGVIVVAACNDASRLDPALVRSGRLDRRFEIGLPDEAALLGIFAHHLPGADVDALRPAATALAGSTSGADVARIAREARRTARRQRREVTPEDLLAIAMPPDTRPEAVRRLSAVHESGHAVVGLMQRRDVRSASILAEPGMNGGVQFGVISPVHVRDIADLAILYLAGRAAEAVVLGTTSLGSGGPSHSDLGQVTNLISGLVAGGGVGALTVGVQPDPAVVERHLQRLYAETIVLVSRHRPQVEALADLLLERRVLGATALREFAEAHGLGGGQ